MSTLRPNSLLSLLAALCLLGGCNEEPAIKPSADKSSPGSFLPAPDLKLAPCGARTKLTGNLTGAIQGSFSYGAGLECESMPRPNGEGARMRFVGGMDSERISIIVAIPDLARGETGQELPSNVTVTIEGSGRFFSSPDLESCWTDVLSQELLEDARYRISAEVYCISALGELNGNSDVSIDNLVFHSIVDWGAS